MTVELASQVSGSGPPLVVLHGLLGSGSNWRSVARALSATHAVHCVDLRNHGASPWSDTMDYPAMAADVVALLDRLGLQRVALLGHSMGGKTAMAVALTEPARVERLVVVDIAPVAYADTLTPLVEAMRAALPAAAATRAMIQQQLARTISEPGVVAFLMQNLVSHGDHFDWRLNLPAIAAAMPELGGFPQALREHRYPGPVTVLAGEWSPYVADRSGEAFRPMFRDVAVEVIAGAGHWVHADQFDAFVASAARALAPDARARAAGSTHS